MSYDSRSSSLHALLQAGNSYTLPKGQIVHALDDYSRFSCIATGYVKRYIITNEGNKSVQLIYGPGHVFPLAPILRHIYDMDLYRGPELYYYESMTDIVVNSISFESLHKALQADKSIYTDLLYVAGTRLNSYIWRLEDTSLGNSTWRVAHQLSFLASQFGEMTETGLKIMVPITHQDLADILNLSRETVSRSIAKLRDKKLIISGQYTVIPDPAKLKDFYFWSSDVT